MFLSLLGFSMGMILAVFHMCGMLFVLSTLLYRLVRYVMASGPRCFRCLMFMLSGPVELLFFDCVMASLTCVSVMFMGVLFRCFVCLSICLFVLCVLCMMLLVNCLLKCSAFCLLVVAVLLLNVIVLFSVCCGFLFESPAMVFQRV